MDYEVYIYHPYLLGKARNSQPCSSCGLASFQSSLPFGLRDILKMYTALAFAKLAPYIHKTLSPVSRLGTLRCTADPDPAIPSAVALGQKGKILFMGFLSNSPCGKSGLVPLYPRHRVYFKEPKPPFFEQICRSQRHRGKVLFTAPCFCFLLLFPLLAGI